MKKFPKWAFELLFILFACMLMTWVSIHYSSELAGIRGAIMNACTPSTPCVRVIR